MSDGKPEFACSQWGAYEHDWMDCPKCIENFERIAKTPVGSLANFAMELTASDSNFYKAFAQGWNAALVLAEETTESTIGMLERRLAFLEEVNRWKINPEWEKLGPASVKCPYCGIEVWTFRVSSNEERVARCYFPCRELFAIRWTEGKPTTAKINWP